jgi:hypothetical protein
MLASVTYSAYFTSLATLMFSLKSLVQQEHAPRPGNQIVEIASAGFEAPPSRPLADAALQPQLSRRLHPPGSSLYGRSAY